MLESIKWMPFILRSFAGASFHVRQALPATYFILTCCGALQLRKRRTNLFKNEPRRFSTCQANVYRDLLMTKAMIRLANLLLYGCQITELTIVMPLVVRARAMLCAFFFSVLPS